MLDALREADPPGDALAQLQRIPMAPQVEAQRMLGAVQHAELSIADQRHRARRQRIDDPEFGSLLH